MAREINPNMIYPIEGSVVLEIRKNIENLIETNKTLGDTVKQLTEELQRAYQEDALEDEEYQRRIEELQRQVKEIDDNVIKVEDIFNIGGSSVETEGTGVTEAIKTEDFEPEAVMAEA